MRIFIDSIFLISLLLSLLIIEPSDCSQPEIILSDDNWDFGTVKEGDKFYKVFIIENKGDGILEIKRFRGSCACFNISIDDTMIHPSEKSNLKVAVDTKGRRNKFKKYVYLETNDPDERLFRITITGIITPKTESDSKSGESATKIKIQENTAPIISAKATPICIVYFTSDTCEECRTTDEALERFMKQNNLLRVRKYDIGDINNYGLLLKMEKAYGEVKNAPPIIYVGTKLLDGWDEVRTKLDAVIKEASISGSAKQFPKEIELMGKGGIASESLIKERFLGIGSVAVISAGLIDGINPCAFTTIVFFVSLLGYFGKSRRDIFLVGFFFTLAIFVTYLLIGLGLFRAVKAFSVSVGIARGITYAAASLAIILGLYSLYDFIICIRKHSHSDMKLKLPKAIHQRIHSVIRSNISSRSLIVAAIIIGFMVSVLESICTGQVYLPTIVFVLRDPVLKLNALSYLVLYNLMFIIPLVIIFLLVYFGVQSSALTKFAQRNLAITKLLLTLLFLSLGVLLFIVS